MLRLYFFNWCVLWAACSLLVPFKASADPIDDAWPVPLERAVRESGFALKEVSIVVLGPQGSPLLLLNPDDARRTASVMKLLTTYVALQELGPNFRFKTDLFANPAPHHSGQWTLMLRGGGDVGLSYEDLVNLLRQAESQGVHGIRGPIIVDNRRFTKEIGLTSGITLSRGALSGLSPVALSVGFSAVQIQLSGQGRRAASVDPGLNLKVMTSQRGALACDPDWLERLKLDVEPASALHRERLVLRGEWPAMCPEAILRSAPLEPNEQLAWSLRAAWKMLGHAYSPPVVEGNAPSYASVSIRHESKPLASLVKDINKYSNNVAARSLLLNMAAERGDLPATPQAGAQGIQKWLEAHDLSFPELKIENGSGLSHHEVLSSRHLAEFLKYVHTSDLFHVFIDSLPIPGEEGTLQSRFMSRPDRLQWHLKTGRLDGVKTLAGYYITRSGEVITLVCMVESSRSDHAGRVQEALLEWIALKENDTNPLNR